MSPTVPVSVVVPVRNAGAHLAAALHSVAAQQPPPAEIVVVDGHSTDGSVAIAGTFPGVRVMAQTGSGLPSARNEAIRQCRYPLVAFCDADDRWAAGSLAARMDALTADPDLLAVIGLAVREEIAGTIPTPAQREWIGRAVPGFTPGAMLVRREAFDHLGWFDERLSIGADSDWFVRLQQSGRPALQIETIVLHKGARGSSLSTDVDAYRRELLTVARRFIDRRRGSPSQ